MRVIGFFVLCFAAVSAIPSNANRNIGGSLTNVQSYPSIAVLLRWFPGNEFRQRCGGVIATNRAILTAAHCIDTDATFRWRVRVGTTSQIFPWFGWTYDVSSIVVHSAYGSGGVEHNNDIAIMRLSRNLQINQNVFPALIAGVNYNVPDNAIVWTAGWGVTVPERPLSTELHHVQINTINQSVCNDRHGGSLTANMLCAGWLSGGAVTCTSDSGGPLYHNGVVVGIVSFRNDCSDPALPGIYTRVSKYSSWIKLHT
ncbi:trypsin, alkaline B-like [Trichoplusia ni]|uniref:Trypsin, alkaline B-like n=1 Tax=Trichoplusia ni TaxID=7111 RepID=A0A7E5WG32_TRINI|nr:trypsin, alkaline B-like [Trichoplusia ni]